ncbi:enoyl-ACP reductase FabI [Streptomyces sp. SL54]|uniref:Enoyl-[acyl-carrier-protein] reductase [NADH] n=1 Tax=Streptantibioticus silvisoli TaxID=2705255 RepID=A0ABT6VYX8_9ACTN|nr:enoyl-ACP reductase FabI [Streptantibioticus silvisoli]MDI5963689.1 enoyl-ACP reductase FabI [Streptantibioticus silvisoli]
MLGFEGRRYLITGVLNDDSIAWHTAKALQEAGAEVLLTGFGRARRITEAAASGLPRPPEVLTLDVTRPEDFVGLAGELTERWGAVDGVLHAVAAAPQEALSGNFLTASPDSATFALRTAAVSLHSLATALAPLLSADGRRGSVVGLDFDASGAWAGYDWMGVSKAALGAVCRYLAMYLGPSGIRVNLVAAGPVETVAGQAISTFGRIADRWEAEAPLGWDRTDPAVLTGPVLFLLSDLAATVTGEIVHADGGMHSVRMGAGPAFAEGAVAAGGAATAKGSATAEGPVAAEGPAFAEGAAR